MPTPSVTSAISAYGPTSRGRRRPSTEEDQPRPIPCAATQASHTTGTATISERLVTSSVSGSARSSSAKSAPTPEPSERQEHRHAWPRPR